MVGNVRLPSVKILCLTIGMIMTVADCVTERGNISEGKTPKNDLKSLSVHSICDESIFFKKNLS